MEEKYYEILRHYVNPNDCATVVKQLLSLHNVVGQSEQLRAFKEFLQSEYHLPVSNRMIDEFKQKQIS